MAHRLRSKRMRAIQVRSFPTSDLSQSEGLSGSTNFSSDSSGPRTLQKSCERDRPKITIQSFKKDSMLPVTAPSQFYHFPRATSQKHAGYRNISQGEWWSIGIKELFKRLPVAPKSEISYPVCINFFSTISRLYRKQA